MNRQYLKLFDEPNPEKKSGLAAVSSQKCWNDIHVCSLLSILSFLWLNSCYV